MRLLDLLTTLLVHAVVSLASQLTTTKHGLDIIVRLSGGGARWYHSGSCYNSLTDPANYDACNYVEWKIVNPDTLRFTIRAKFPMVPDYVKIAISEDDKLGGFSDDDSYECTRTATGSSLFNVTSSYISGRDSTTIIGPADNSSFDLTGDQLTCSFLRRIVVTKRIELFDYDFTEVWNLNTNSYYMLYAAGEVNPEGQALSHKTGNGSFSSTTQAINYLYWALEEPAVNPMDDITPLYGAVGRWKVRRNCNPISSPCRYIDWKLVSSGIQFTISGPGPAYVGMAISRGADMGHDDAYLCLLSTLNSSSTVNVVSAYLNGSEPPVVLTQVPSTFRVNASTVGGVIRCTFVRSLSVTKLISGKNITWNLLTEVFNMTYIEGSLTSAVHPCHPTYTASTNGAFNYLANRSYHRNASPNRPTVPTPTTAAIPQTTSSSKSLAISCRLLFIFAFLFLYKSF